MFAASGFADSDHAINSEPADECPNLQFEIVHVMFFVGIMSDYSYGPAHARKGRGWNNGASQVFRRADRPIRGEGPDHSEVFLCLGKGNYSFR